MLFKKEVIVRTGNFLQKKHSAWHASFTGFGSFADVLSERKAATRRGDGPSACAEPSEEPAHFPERPPLVPGRVPRNDAGPARSALVRDLAAHAPHRHCGLLVAEVSGGPRLRGLHQGARVGDGDFSAHDPRHLVVHPAVRALGGGRALRRAHGGVLAPSGGRYHDARVVCHGAVEIRHFDLL